MSGPRDTLRFWLTLIAAVGLVVALDRYPWQPLIRIVDDFFDWLERWKPFHR